MPFFDNTGIDPEVKRGPLWGAFASLFDQLERYIALNIAWALQLVPLMLAVIYPELPTPIRLLLTVYTGLALPAATGVLYGLVYAAVADNEPLTLQLARDMLRRMALPGLLTLMPLLAIFGLLLGLSAWAGAGDEGGVLFIIAVLARLGLLFTLASSMYWGALLAENPMASALAIARKSFALVWREPGRTVLLLGSVILAGGIGVVSVGGIFLVVPVVIALLHIHMYRHIVSG